MIDYSKNEYFRVGNFTNVVNEVPKKGKVQGGGESVRRPLGEFRRYPLRHG